MEIPAFLLPDLRPKECLFCTLYCWSVSFSNTNSWFLDVIFLFWFLF